MRAAGLGPAGRRFRDSRRGPRAGSWRGEEKRIQEWGRGMAWRPADERSATIVRREEKERSVGEEGERRSTAGVRGGER
jgi:hypothetical protein